jgi:hypothetical protein
LSRPEASLADETQIDQQEEDLREKL